MPKKKSRKVDTYVKSKTIKEAVKFPYSRYRIEWIDIITEGGWGSEREFKNMKLATPISEGWLFSKDKHYVKLFAAYIPEDDGTYTFGDRTNIPTSWVVKITKI